MGKMFPELKSSPVITRYRGGEPVLSKKDIPYDAECIFNAGVTKFRGKYVMVFRNDSQFNGISRFGKCVIGIAFSEDGIHWDVQDKPFLTVEDMKDPDVKRVYDPRLTVIDGRCYLCFAVDTNHGVRGGVAVTDDFKTVEVLSLTVPDNRNMVLFPEKVDGKYVRLERTGYCTNRSGEWSEFL